MSGETVSIGCKHPHGFRLNLDHYVKVGDQGSVNRINGNGGVVIKGWSRIWGAPDHTHGGYAVTDISADFWNEWLKTHADFPPLKDGTLFVSGTRAKAEAQAREQTAVPAIFAPARPEDVPGTAKYNKDD